MRGFMPRPEAADQDSRGSLVLFGKTYDYELMPNGNYEIREGGDLIVSVEPPTEQVGSYLLTVLRIQECAYSLGLIHGANKAFDDLRRLIRAEDRGSADALSARLEG